MSIPDLALMGETLSAEGAGQWGKQVTTVARRAASQTHGDLARWQAALTELPQSEPAEVTLDQPVITIRGRRQGEADTARLRDALLQLRPWRKGPFQLHGVGIDAEWRCDIKWDRLVPHISDLTNRRILDVGCSNGYYALRMLGGGARWVLGADPTLLFAWQYRAIRHFAGPLPLWFVPAALEALPPAPCGLDTVFSMGVLYHRRSPLDHLRLLRRWLRPGGELVLETLVVPGGADTVFVPAGRYARMRNVWFLPSVAALAGWLERCGFVDVRCVDTSATTAREQRTTEWMPFESLDRALDPTDPGTTTEGHPAPLRAMLLATARH